MRIASITSVLILLFLLDALSTAYLVENFDGQELNPYIDTTSFLTILLSPAHFIVAGAVIICLIYAEFNESRFHIYMKTFSIKLWPFFFPFYFMILKTLAIVNNTFPIIGFSTPIHWLRMPFRVFSDDASIQALMLCTALAFLLAPLFIALARTLYGRKEFDATQTSKH